MTLTFNLLTAKPIGHILDSWWASVWSFMTIGGLQGQLWYENHFQSPVPHDLDLWRFDLKINRAHPWLLGNKFHDNSWIKGSVMVRNHFQSSTPLTLTFNLLTQKSHHLLMGSMCMKFHDHTRLITESVMIQKPFTFNHATWTWPFTFWPQNQ